MRCRPVALGVAALLGLGSVARADETPKPRYVDVAVETQSLASAGPVVRRRVRERADVVLRRSGVLPPRDGRDPVLSIEIDDLTGEDPGYVFRVQILHAGSAQGTAPFEECRLCTEGELVDAIEGRIEGAVAQLPVVEPAAKPLPPPRITDPSTVPKATTASVAPPPPALRITGATLVGAGLGTTVAGAVLASLAPKPKASQPLEEISTKKPGLALVGVGLGVAVVGAVVLILDAHRRARSPRSDH